jgi:hypothetical protein
MQCASLKPSLRGSKLNPSLLHAAMSKGAVAAILVFHSRFMRRSFILMHDYF